MPSSLPNRAISVLILEDERVLREAMVSYLNLEGYAASGVGSLGDADAHLAAQSADILIIDLGLPDGDGLAWLQSHPELRDCGLIIATARGASIDRLAGIRAGADNYLVKPIALEELSALISNLAQRLHPSPSAAWVINPLNWTLLAPQGENLRLTHSESILLACLAQSPGKPVPRPELIVALGENPDTYDPRRMEILVRRLRSKAEASLGIALPLQTVHGQGYAFAGPIRFNDGE